MASVPLVMRRMLTTCRSEERLPSDEEFEANRAAYQEILEAAIDLGGEEPLDELSEWAVSWTKARGQLPTPERFRRQTRRVLTDRGVEVPEDSVLAAP